MEDREQEGEEEEEDEETQILRGRFRLSAISIAESEAKKNAMKVSEPIIACISDLAFNYAAHRNENLGMSLRTFSDDLKAKEPQSERKRKKASRKEDKATTSALQIDDL